MNPALKKRLSRTIFMSFIAVVIGVGIGWMQVQNERKAAPVQNETTSQRVPGVQVGGPFELVNQDGKTTTEKDFAGSYKLIYFGFTYCPAICPTELQKITDVLNKTDPAIAAGIQPLFITIDPERDTVDVMRGYVTLFHPRLVGLTGSRAQIDTVLSAYRVFAQKVQEPNMSDYTMDHSSFIYLMDKNDTLVSIYRIEDDADFILKDLREKLATG